jgi:hypothetical protein
MGLSQSPTFVQAQKLALQKQYTLAPQSISAAAINPISIAYPYKIKHYKESNRLKTPSQRK